MRSKVWKMPSRKRLLGLSLIELMVALLLGLIIVAAVSQLFVNISRANQEMAKTNSQIENARFAMQFLQEDIAHAGFWDTYVPQFDDLSTQEDPEDVPGAIPDPCRPYEEWNNPVDDAPVYTDYRNELLGIPVQVTSAAPGTCGAVIVDQVPDTDVLVVRHANTCEAGAANCEDTGVATQFYFQASLNIDDTEAYLLEPLEVDLPDLDPLETDPLEPTFTLRDRLGTAPAPLRKFIQSIYYVRSWANDPPSMADPDGDGIPTLVRSQFDVVGGVLAQQEAVALVEGIERFRVEVGIDNLSEPYTGFPNGTPSNLDVGVDWLDDDNWVTAVNRGDGIPDGDFVHCPTLDPLLGCSIDLPDYQLLNVVAVKVYVLARANEATPGYTDSKTYTMGSSGAIGPFDNGFKRHVFSTTIRLNNVSARRETP